MSDAKSAALFAQLDHENKEIAKLGRIIKTEQAAFNARCGDGAKNGCAKVAILNLKNTSSQHPSQETIGGVSP